MESVKFNTHMSTLRGTGRTYTTQWEAVSATISGPVITEHLFQLFCKRSPGSSITKEALIKEIVFKWWLSVKQHKSQHLEMKWGWIMVNHGANPAGTKHKSTNIFPRYSSNGKKQTKNKKTKSRAKLDFRFMINKIPEVIMSAQSSW